MLHGAKLVDRASGRTGLGSAAAIALIGAMTLSGAAVAQDEPAIPDAEGVNVGVSIWGHVPWLDSYGDFLVQYGEEAGANMNVLYSDMTAATQASQVDILLAQDPDVILYTGLDPEADNGILAKIEAAGVPVVAGILEPTAEGMEIVDAYRGPNDFDHGRIGAEALAAALEGKDGSLAMVRGAAGGTDNLNRAAAFTERMAELRPDLEIVADQDSDWADQKIPYDVTSAMLAQHDDIISTTLQDPEIGAIDVLKVGLELAAGEEVEKIGYMDLPVLTQDNVDDFECHW